MHLPGRIILFSICLTFLGVGWVHCQPSYKGGKGDGAVTVLLENNTAFYSGGDDDGHNVSEFNNSSFFYQGGKFDGADFSHIQNNNEFYSGGGDDGYTDAEWLFYFIWDGSTGTGWGVASNWETDVVPSDERRVRIPAGVPNFPFVNAGTLKVGDDSGTGTFQAKEIIIEPGALMVTRINNFIENYGLICVEGILEIRNSDPQAFKNLSGANLIIKTGGELRTNF